MTDVKAVIFDMDDTLIRTGTVWREAERMLFNEHGITELTKHEEIIEHLLKTSTNKYEEIDNYIISVIGANLKPEDLVEVKIGYVAKLYKTSIPIIEGVEEFLNYLNLSNIPFSIATENYKELKDIIVDKFECLSNLHHALDYSNISKNKPDPEIYLKFLELHGVKPNECIVFEDRKHGIEAAREAGIERIFAIVNQNISEEETSWIKENTIMQFKNYSEILKIIPDIK